ncbi:MAG: hypothetical protein JXM79_21560 [Sedimentisphaerales bacterium]|nr:hypothetical protein [Sedimentisphaerales bacterium]
MKAVVLWPLLPPLYHVLAEFIILDGNHRAYKLAEYHQNINALVINRETDRNDILELEKQRVIPPFPHREFLMGKRTLLHLKIMAKKAAEKSGHYSISEILKNNISKMNKQKTTKFHDIPITVNEQRRTKRHRDISKKIDTPFGRDLIEEYYKIKKLLHRVPTVIEIEKYGKYPLYFYREKFGEWDRFVDLMEKDT